MSSGRGISRSVRLFSAFRVEQTEPDRFYGALADDSIALLRDWTELRDRVVLDVGAGPRQFADAFRAAGARYVPVDHDPMVSSVADGGVVATAAALPLADRSVDLVFSSNLWEHVREPEAVADEMVRVVRPGGLVFLSYTNWLSPWGGHETSPWHWLGGKRAARRYERRHGHPPKNTVDRTLFRVSVAQGLRWARRQPEVEVLVARPRYLPDVAEHLLKVPGARELLTWNLLLILRRR
ncbi:methyltransferase domain-containing protein [Luteipulveratus flavus]|uniref:Methyltransferase domain-containing protein n=1 Tax=Luteipulveratus flavus TaxID=3031728 RepID=A0ABT6C5G4_9MICO|nr:methyltransferase domain-containing protein [Luteipulveratus sp. YIM 133296]MDF8264083.1 methyltransferase domain-containing protein [Luteipulveratus sp. YIM 133296]